MRQDCIVKPAPTVRRLGWVIASLLLLVACQAPQDEEEKEVGYELEEQHLSAYLGKGIPVHGKVLKEDGTPLADASVTFGSVNATTDSNGGFTIQADRRVNELLVVTAPGFRKEQLPVVTLLPESKAALNLEPILLSPTSGSTVRMLFGGDTAFGRRWLSPSVETPRDMLPPDDPAALILASNPGPGTEAALQWIKPHFQEADWRVLNLETPITKHVDSYHRTKEYCFFSLPGSLPPLKALGVDYVSLGNNHVYDYQEEGLQDTLDNLDKEGIKWSGAGPNVSRAFQPFDVALKGTRYSFFSACSIDGKEDGILPHYAADPYKGGSADLKDETSVKNSIAQAAASATVIAQPHFGFEYALQPSVNGRKYVQAAVDAGAKLVVSNHSHVAQGAGLLTQTGTANQIPVLWCLGNLALDQDRLETFLGSLARVDMNGASVQTIRFLPVYLEDYRPRLVNGFLADYLVRRQAEFSDSNVLVFPYLGQGWVLLDPAQAKASTRTVTHTVVVPASGEAVVDLRDLLSVPGESLAQVSASGATFQTGRDILVYGDFEDWDSDEDRLEAARWDLKRSRLCLEAAFSGAAGLRTKRSSSNRSDSVTAFRERVRVEGDNVNKPNKELSLLGHVRGTNAGTVTIRIRYMASKGEKVFEEKDAYTRAAGTYDWETFAVPLKMPDEDVNSTNYETEQPRALRLFLRHSPGTTDVSIADFDNLAVVSWQLGNPAKDVMTLKTPHALDFLKVRAPKGTYTLNLTFKNYRPQSLP